MWDKDEKEEKEESTMYSSLLVDQEELLDPYWETVSEILHPTLNIN